MDEVSVINNGDGRILFKKLNEEKTPLQGKHRIINGYRKTYYSDGKTLQDKGKFVEGKLHSVCKSYYQNGKVETEVCYKMGDQDGYDRRYNEDGSLVCDTHYKDGKPDGNCVEHLSGSVDFTRCSSYKNGVLTGEYSETLKNGNLRKKDTYKEG